VRSAGDGFLVPPQDVEVLAPASTLRSASDNLITNGERRDTAASGTSRSTEARRFPSPRHHQLTQL
jgi:hypothetical protein